MSEWSPVSNRLRVRWAAIGAAVAVTLGAGTIATVDAIQSSGERLTYTAIEPCRLMNTRPGPNQVGPRTTPLPEGQPITVNARGDQGNCTATDLPDDAAALQLNVTPVNATEATDITIWPDGPIPQASSVNPRPGPPDPNAVTATLALDGTFQMQNKFGTIDMVIDVVGHYRDHHHDDRYPLKDEVYSKDEIDDRLPTSDVVSFPAQSLNYGNVGTITRDSSGEGLRWQNSAVGGATIEIARPPAWDGTSDVTLRISYHRTTNAAGIVAFFARPDSQAVGDDVATGSGVFGPGSGSSGEDVRRIAAITLPADRLDDGEIWKIGIQRDVPLVLPYPGDLIVSSVSLTFDTVS